MKIFMPKYIGDKLTMIFHNSWNPNCQVKGEDREEFGSKDEAEKAGFNECPKCFDSERMPASSERIWGFPEIRGFSASRNTIDVATVMDDEKTSRGNELKMREKIIPD